MTAMSGVPVDPSNARSAPGLGWRRGGVLGRPCRLLRPFGRRIPQALVRRRRDHRHGAGPRRRLRHRSDHPRRRPGRRGGSALGVDLSAHMLDYARRRAAEEGVTNASFQQVDAQIHPFPPGAFDAAISRTGAMFFGDLTAAFTNIGRALVPGGRLVLVAWQPLPANEWIREISGALSAGRDRPAPPPDAPGPFSLSDPDRVRTILTATGFTNIELEGTTPGFGSAPTPTTRTGSCLGSWAGCSTGSTTPVALALWTGYEPRWPPTRPAKVSCSARPLGRSGPHGDERRHRTSSDRASRSNARRTSPVQSALDESATTMRIDADQERLYSPPTAMSRPHRTSPKCGWN